MALRKLWRGRRLNKLILTVFIMGVGVNVLFFSGIGYEGSVKSERRRPGKDVMEFRLYRYTEYTRTQGKRTGPGEMGQGVWLSNEELRAHKERIDKEGFNVRASEKIALDRSLQDTRDPL